MAASTVLQAFKKACSSYLRLARLSLFVVFLPLKTLYRRICSQAMSHPLSVKKHRLNFNLPLILSICTECTRILTLEKRVTNRTLYHSSLLKTLVYLTCSFHVILHYCELWVLNEYLELLTTQIPVFIGSK